MNSRMIAYMLVLSIYTGYLLLDTFAISRVYGDATAAEVKEV